MWLYATRQVFAGPVGIDAAGDFTSAEVVSAPSADDLDFLHPIPADLDGDGLGDFLALSDTRNEIGQDWVGGSPVPFDAWMWAVAGGAALSSGADLGTVFDLGGGRKGLTDPAAHVQSSSLAVAVEDNMVFTLVEQGPPYQDVPSVLIVVDLGPGAATPAP